ncbi:MAG TPA: efflux RND transporter periplasmic adaptor subunit [Spirochaetota bacterium]|nr:efflux RND transporter periplasmic adaptor subunit [Spirochaetota bacterium]HPJ34757.1 efflux RND transporter periplasmic adaptor subunit [Spirochaetota bacterium]
MTGRFKNIMSGVLSRKKIIAVVLLIIACTGIAYETFVKPAFLEKSESAVRKGGLPGDIRTASVESRDIRDTIDILGEIVFREKVNISSKVNGRLAGIRVREGENVRRGELIAEIERLPLEITLKQQESELDIAKKALELSEAKYSDALKGVEIKLKTIQKAKTGLYDKKVSYENMELVLKNRTELFKAGGISRTELEGIKTQYTTLQAKYELARADYEIQQVGYRDQDIVTEGLKVPSSEREKLELFKRINTKIERAELESAKSKVKQTRGSLLSTELLLKETYIRSPLNGVVAVRNMEAGEMVREDSVIATVIDISRVYISMNLNEKEVRRVKKGQVVKFTVDALGESREFSGKIETITPLLDTKSRTLEVRAAIKNPGRELLPGMFSRAVIDTGKNVKGLLIPAGAVVKKEGGREEVYLVKNGIAILQQVTSGNRHGDDIAIVEGLREGDAVVVKGVSSVYQGMKIR